MRFKEQLTFDITEANFNEEKGVVKNVALFYRESKNGRWYDDIAIDSLVRLMHESNNSFIDHDMGHSAEDFLGTVHNIRREGNKVFGDLKVARHKRDFFFGVLETRPKSGLGFSVDITAKIKPGKGPDGLDLIEDIKKLWSTDFVVNPATTKNLFEDENGVNEVLGHNSKLADSEPSWGGVDKTKLSRKAFADMGEEDKKSTWSYPHHWVKGGETNDDGIYEDGTMYLHRGGLIAAWAAAQGARSGGEASPAVKSHLQKHRKALGMTEEDIEQEVEQYLEETNEGNNPHKEETIMKEQLLRTLEALGVDTAGLEDATEAQLQKAVDKAVTGSTREELDALNDRVETLESEKSDLEEELDSVKEERDDLKEEKADLEKGLDDYKAKEAEAELRAEVEEAIEEAEIPERLVTDLFVQTCMDATEEKRAELIAERKDIAESSPKVNLGGSRKEREDDVKGDRKKESGPRDDDELISSLKKAKRE